MIFSLTVTLNFQQEEELSEEVRKYPAIYDKSRKEHRERDVVRNAWKAGSS